jgi:hypothetical protein
MLAAPAVGLDFSYQGCADDTVAAPLVQNEIIRDVLILDGCIDEEDSCAQTMENL